MKLSELAKRNKFFHKTLAKISLPFNNDPYEYKAVCLDEGIDLNNGYVSKTEMTAKRNEHKLTDPGHLTDYKVRLK